MTLHKAVPTPLPIQRQIVTKPTAYQDIVLPAALNGADQAGIAFIDFFAATIANPNTRQAYMRDVARFFNWCSRTDRNPLSLSPLDLASYREELRATAEPTTVKRHFSALRSLYRYWVEKGVLDSNPVREFKTEKVSRTEGKTPAVEWEDMGELFQRFHLNSVVGLRDQALIATMAYSFARVTAVVSLKVRDCTPRGADRYSA